LTPYNFNVAGQQNQVGVSTNPSQPSLSQIAATYNSVTVSVNYRSYYNYTYSCDQQNNVPFTGNITASLSRTGNFQLSVNVFNNQRGNYASASNSLNVYSAPAVLQVTFVSATYNSITVNISGYNYDNSNTLYYNGTALSLSGRPGQQIISNLAPGTGYTIYVNSTNNYGTTQSNSIYESTANQPPNQPIGLAQNVGASGSNYVTVFWNSDPVVTSYRWALSNGSSGTINAPVTQFLTEQNLTPNSSFIFTLTPYNGTSVGTAATVTVLTFTGQITLTGTNITDKGVDLSWATPGWSDPNNSVRYDLFINNFKSGSGLTGTSLSISVLRPLITYNMYLEAINSLGTSPVRSNTLQITTLDAIPGVPTLYFIMYQHVYPNYIGLFYEYGVGGTPSYFNVRLMIDGTPGIIGPLQPATASAPAYQQHGEIRIGTAQGVLPGNVHSISVAACNSRGCSDYTAFTQKVLTPVPNDDRYNNPNGGYSHWGYATNVTTTTPGVYPLTLYFSPYFPTAESLTVSEGSDKVISQTNNSVTFGGPVNMARIYATFSDKTILYAQGDFSYACILTNV
jgi:hypothetical protein